MRRKRLFAIFAAAILAAAATAQTLPQGVQKVTSIEGVTEYAYANGLHVLLFPDNSKPKVTVNVVYRVGSRNEGYGETGMAHLLEHMVFKTTKSGREVFKELTDRAGGSFNGTTSYDQTMYFETFNASDENLRWALGLEAARMVNMTMLQKDLDTEMTVVRNEMENGENSPLNVLRQRVLAAAYNFHNYGKTVIGNRTDVERVPIANLAVFYQKYYQPDNADLIIAGQIDEAKALAMVAETFGAIPKPQRVLTQPYTAEPTQEGERSVTLRRVGNLQGVIVVYHIPAALHPDMAALEVMSQVLGAQQTGRLYKALVDNKKAVGASMNHGIPNVARKNVGPAFRATPWSGFAARCSSTLKTVSVSSGAPAEAAMRSAVRKTPFSRRRSARRLACRTRTAAAAFFPASTPGWWDAVTPTRSE